MARPVLIIFAKAPRRGQVKRRLAAGTGEAVALSFYLRQLRDRLLSLRDRRWTTVLALSGPWRVPVPLRAVAQGRGDLGTRMRRALDRFREPAVLIGADIPDIGRDHIAAAFDALAGARFVFGPAEDGGYWLVGTRRRRPLPKRVFTKVRWSTPAALAETLASLPQGKVALTARMADVDDAAGLLRWRRESSR